MRTVTVLFRTQLEARAFDLGVQWINDSAVELKNSEHRGDDFALIYSDEDGIDGEDVELDYR